MIKKNVLLTLVLAGLALGVTLSLSSCNKSKTEESTTTVQDLFRGAGDYIECPHCGYFLYDQTYAADPLDFDHYHAHYYGPGFVNHPDFNGLQCPITYCRFRTANHIHECVFFTDSFGDHYQDDWIHVGGGAGGQ